MSYYDEIGVNRFAEMENHQPDRARNMDWPGGCREGGFCPE